MDNPAENENNKRDEEIPSKGQQRIAAPSSSFASSVSSTAGGNNADDAENLTPDSENTGQDDPTQTALLLPEILENILGFLETRDLLRCRSVNRTWCEIITPIIRKKGPIINFEKPSEMFRSKSSTDGGDYYSMNYSDSETKDMKIEDTSFLDTMSKSNNIPCAKFSIEVKEDLNEYQALIDTVGSVITYLEINSKWNTEGIETFRNWMSSMKKLQTLKLDFSKIFQATNIFEDNDEVKLEALTSVEINIRGVSKIFPGFFDDFFSRAQNLQRLKLDLNGYRLDRTTNIQEIYESNEIEEAGVNTAYQFYQVITDINVKMILASLKDHGAVSLIKDMHITLLKDTSIDILLEMSANGLKLKSFELGSKYDHHTFHNEYNDTEKFRMFLEGQTDNLEILIVNQGTRLIELPKKLSALKSLHVRRSDKVLFTSVFHTPVDFSKQFSCLAELKMKGCWSVLSIKDFFAQIDEPIPSPCSTLKTLRLAHGDYLDEEGMISKIANIFPNVCNLDLRHPRNDSLEEVWASWPGLTDLKIVAFHSEEDEYEDVDECLDAGFTGIETYLCIYNKKTEGNWIAESNQIIKRFKKQPSITDLKDLRNLELKLISVRKDSDGNPAGGAVTKLLIYLALIKMPHLKHLKIYEWLPAAETNHCVMGSTYDLPLDSVEDLKRTLEDTQISVMSIYGRDFKISGADENEYGEMEYLTDLDEEAECCVKALSVLSNGKYGSVRHRGYMINRSPSFYDYYDSDSEIFLCF